MTKALPPRASKLRPSHWLAAPYLAMRVHHTLFLSVHSLCAGVNKISVTFSLRREEIFHVTLYGEDLHAGDTTF
jgi:hypothetical protein